MVKKTSKSTENKCSHCALRLILIGKDAHRKGNIRHVINWSQAISGHLSCLFRSKIAKIAKDKCSHYAMGLDYCFRWLSLTPSQRNIALWVHPLTTATQVPAARQHPQPAHTRCLNVYLWLQIPAALLKLTTGLNICCTCNAADLLRFSI